MPQGITVSEDNVMLVWEHHSSNMLWKDGRPLLRNCSKIQISSPRKMLICWKHLSWESLWHKPKEMLIAEPYEASIRAPKDLTGLGHLAWGLPPHPAHGPGAPCQFSLRHPALPWEILEVSLCPNCGLNYHSGLTSHLAGGHACAWWSLGCLLNPALLTSTERPFTCQACFSTAVHDKCISAIFVSRPHSHFGFLNGQTSQIPVN